MAQIIQHKRGVLEDLAGVTSPNVGELLVVTGSSISALADGLVFVGNSSSEITAVNRILTGSSTPVVTGGSYNTFVDGIPFYNTSSKRLDILAKGGNVRVELDHSGIDFDGSGIVSGSSQVFSDVSGDITIASNGTAAIGTGVIVNADINGSAAIASSKINYNGTGIVSSSAQVSSLAGINNSTITVGVAGGLTVSADADFTLNQSGNQTITIGTDGSGILSGSVGVGSVVTDAAFAQGADSIVFFDATDSSIRRDSVTDFLTAIAGDNLTVSSNQLVANAGDVTNVIGGTGLSDSGNSGDITINFTGDGTGVISGSGQLTDMTGDVTVNSSGVSSIGTGVIVNADVSTTAAIASSKINYNSTGIVSGSSQVYSGVSGDVTIASNGTAAIGTGVIVDADVNGSAAIASSKINYDGTGIVSSSAQVSSLAGINNSTITLAGAGGLSINEADANFTLNQSGNQTLTVTTDGSGIVSGSSQITDGSGIVSSSAFSSPSQGTVRAVINGTTTNVDTGLQTGDSPTFTNLTLSGNLTVNGDTVQTNVTTMNVEDNIINLNFGGSATNGGLYVGDVTGTTTSGSILWDGSNDYWIAGAKDSEKRVILEGGSAGTNGTVVKFDGAGSIVNSIITESGTTVTISNNLILNGLTASSFLHANASKQLTSVSTSTDGDILVSNGSGTFTATNTLDGGTF